jgi:hypothetical protein
VTKLDTRLAEWDKWQTKERFDRFLTKNLIFYFDKYHTILTSETITEPKAPNSISEK